MTRIAVIADIHGNLPALEAVLDDIAAQGVDEVLVGGDLVGRGPQGSAVARRIRELGLPAIRGNHEDYLLDFRHRRVPEGWQHEEAWAAARWMAAELDDEDEAYIASLPFALERRSLVLVHGTPESNRAGIGPWTRDDELDAHLARAGAGRRDGAPLLVCAHTHRPLDRRRDGGRVVNVGSVGLPFNRDRRAQYAIFGASGDGGDTGNGWDVEPRQVPYDLEEIIAVYDRSGFLAAGGVTARLLRLELEHATPLLVPYMAWAEVTGAAPTLDSLEPFLAFRQVDQPTRAFFQRLRALRDAGGSGEPSR